MSTIEFAIDDVIKQLFPVGLRDDFDLEALSFEEAFFLGDNDWGTISELDKTEF